MTDWIRALAVSFAKRLVQEVRQMDTMEELIRRECNIADELVAVIVIQCDELVHTDEQPFCMDPKCPCKDDLELYATEVSEPFCDGLLTVAEAVRLFEGKQL